MRNFVKGLLLSTVIFGASAVMADFAIEEGQIYTSGAFVDSNGDLWDIVDMKDIGGKTVFTVWNSQTGNESVTRVVSTARTMPESVRASVYKSTRGLADYYTKNVGPITTGTTVASTSPATTTTAATNKTTTSTMPRNSYPGIGDGTPQGRATYSAQDLYEIQRQSITGPQGTTTTTSSAASSVKPTTVTNAGSGTNLDAITQQALDRDLDRASRNAQFTDLRSSYEQPRATTSAFDAAAAGATNEVPQIKIVRKGTRDDLIPQSEINAALSSDNLVPIGNYSGGTGNAPAAYSATELELAALPTPKISAGDGAKIMAGGSQTSTNASTNSAAAAPSIPSRIASAAPDKGADFDPWTPPSDPSYSAYPNAEAALAAQRRDMYGSAASPTTVPSTPSNSSSTPQTVMINGVPTQALTEEDLAGKGTLLPQKRAIGSANDGAPATEARDLDRYQVILDRQPFGPGPGASDSAAAAPVPDVLTKPDGTQTANPFALVDAYRRGDTAEVERLQNVGKQSSQADAIHNALADFTEDGHSVSIEHEKGNFVVNQDGTFNVYGEDNKTVVGVGKIDKDGNVSITEVAKNDANNEFGYKPSADSVNQAPKPVVDPRLATDDLVPYATVSNDNVGVLGGKDLFGGGWFSNNSPRIDKDGNLVISDSAANILKNQYGLISGDAAGLKNTLMSDGSTLGDTRGAALLNLMHTQQNLATARSNYNTALSNYNKTNSDIENIMSKAPNGDVTKLSDSDRSKLKDLQSKQESQGKALDAAKNARDAAHDANLAAAHTNLAAAEKKFNNDMKAAFDSGQISKEERDNLNDLRLQGDQDGLKDAIKNLNNASDDLKNQLSADAADVDNAQDIVQKAGEPEGNDTEVQANVEEVHEINPVELVFQYLAYKKANDKLSVEKDLNIKAGEIGEPMQPVDSSALPTDDGSDGTRATTVLGAASMVKQLLSAATIDLNLLSEKVTFDTPEGPTTENLPGASVSGGGSSVGGGAETPEPGADDDDDDDGDEDDGDNAQKEAIRKEIERRRAELLKQYVSAGIQIAEGMNAISNDFPSRAGLLHSTLEPTNQGGNNNQTSGGKSLGSAVRTEPQAFGLMQDVGRYVLFETLRGVALSSVQMGVQASRLLFVTLPDLVS